MNITINEVKTEVGDGLNLTEVLKLKNISPAGIALALNGSVIPRGQYDSTQLKDGDALLIIKAFYGG